MKTTAKTAVVALVSLFSTAAAAQIPVPPGAGSPTAPASPAPAPAPVTGTPAAPATPPAPPAEVPPPAPEAPPPPPATIDERVGELEQKFEGLNESFSETKSSVSSMSKLKFSGYIQGRYDWRGDSVSGVDGSGRPTNFNRWEVRRGRLKATYTGDMAEYLLQIDATGDAVVLKDAEATFVEPWTPLNMRFTIGQFKVPFGYEILQSSADREMPERARVIRALFPGERDRGARLTARYEWFRFQAALVNGNFTQGDPVYATLDQNRFMDTYIRVGADFGFIVGNVSLEYGERLGTTNTTFVDTNMNGVIDVAEATAVTSSTRRFGIWRIGADAQFYYDITGLGGLALKAEVVAANDENRVYRGVAADPCRDLKGFGYILTGTQNIGDYLGIAARWDVWNPNRDVAAGTSTTCTAAATKASDDTISTLGIGPLVFISGNLKLSGIYEHVWRSDTYYGLGSPGVAPASSIGRNLFTLQLQARF